MKITCCRGCVAPKRYPGCQDHCPDLHTERILKIVEEADQMNQKRIEDGPCIAQNASAIFQFDIPADQKSQKISVFPELFAES